MRLPDAAFLCVKCAVDSAAAAKLPASDAKEKLACSETLRKDSLSEVSKRSGL